MSRDRNDFVMDISVLTGQTLLIIAKTVQKYLLSKSQMNIPWR